MASYSFIIKNAAKKEIKSLPDRYQKKVFYKMKEISNDPFLTGTKKLKDQEDLYRVRVGVYRIIYQIDLAENEINILRVRHRKNAYQNL